MDSGKDVKAQEAFPHQQQGYPPMQPPNYPAGNSQYNPNAPTQTVIVRQSQSAQPNDYLTLAIFVTLCCCLPLGIVAIVQGTNVRSRFAAGDAAGAEEASRSAKSWTIAGLVAGIISYVIGVIIVIIYIFAFASAITSVQDGIDGFDFQSYT